MFEFAFITGIFSYVIFFLGISNILFKNLTQLFFIVFFILSTVVFFKTENLTLGKLKKIKLDIISKILFTLLLLQIIVNFVGVLGPEIAFDSLWYHLTLPKLYLVNNSIFHIPGNLTYFYDLPKLMEMVYVGGLSLGGETLVKSTHFLFGILSLLVIYKISKIFLPLKFSLLSALIFYSNPVVGWESITAYVDLGRTFFELLGILSFIYWIEKREFKWLAVSSSMLGLAVYTKLLSVLSLAPFLVFIIFLSYKTKSKLFLNVLSFFTLSFFFSLPWFLFSLFNTGNPVYPLGEYTITAPVDSLNILQALEDPISPLYLIFFPLIIANIKKFDLRLIYIFVYSLMGFVLWYFLSRLSGARYLLPYLAAFSVVLSFTVFRYSKNKFFYYFLICLVLITSLISIFYRSFANYKFLSVLLGKESKAEFLTKNLDFSYGDFYDTDGYFQKHIKAPDKVLLYGFHNLYYVDFPFIHSTWVKKGDKFNYIATQNSIIPKRFSNWNLVYYNNQTKVKVYTLEGKVWEY